MNLKIQQIVVQFIFIYSLLYISTSQAATPADSTDRFFFGFNYGKGATSDFHAEIQGISSSGFSIGAHFIYQRQESSAVPSDYSPGLTIFGPSEPHVEHQSFAFTLGKVIPNKTQFLKFHLQGGILLGVRSEPCDFIYSPPAHFLDLGSNYSYTTRKEKYFGAMLSPSVILYSRVIGIKLGAYLNLNTVQSTVSGEVGLILGRFRKKIQ